MSPLLTPAEHMEVKVPCICVLTCNAGLNLHDTWKEEWNDDIEMRTILASSQIGMVDVVVAGA